MRLRNETLKTGSLLTYLHPAKKENSSEILFLVTGADDISVLQMVEKSVQGQEDRGFTWSTVADQFHRNETKNKLTSSAQLRLEATELSGLSQNAINSLLAPIFEQMKNGEKLGFPEPSRVLGSIAQGIHFLAREEELEQIHSLLQQDTAILLVAPRRTGKTSMLHRLKDKCTDFSFHYLDLESIENSKAFSAKLYAVAKKLPFRSALKIVHEQGWKEILLEAFKAFQSNSQDKPFVLLLDEIVYFLQELAPSEKDKSKVIDFLQHFGQAYHKVGIGLIVSGSISLLEYLYEEFAIAEQDLASHFTTIKQLPLGPLASTNLELELRRLLLGQGLVLQNKDLDWMVDTIDLAMPFPTMKFLDSLTHSIREAQTSFQKDRLEQELERFIRETEAFEELKSKFEKLSIKDFTKSTRVEEALRKLTEIAPSPISLSRSDLLEMLGEGDKKEAEKVLRWLKDTFPIFETDDGIACTSKLFSRWWRKYQDGM